VEYVLSMVAAALLGAGYVLHGAAQQARKAHFLRMQLLADLLHRPRWLACGPEQVASPVPA